MVDSLFITELPLVNSDEELEQIKAVYKDCDPYFIASGCIKERRDKFNKLWENYHPYKDVHFLSQIKSNFHQRSWEMYVGNVLLGKSLSIKSENEGPDFIVNNNIYIECVAPTKGDSQKPDSVPKMFIAKTPEEICVQDVPVDKIILRITGAIKDKALDQYEKWKSKNWFDSKIPFVIAINTGDFGYGEGPDMPEVLKALFGFHFLQIDRKTSEISFSHRDQINKSNNQLVPVNYFASKDFSFVSGVLFSNREVLNHPEKIGDDCLFVNNPFADNPVDESFLNFFKVCFASKDDTGVYLKKGY